MTSPVHMPRLSEERLREILTATERERDEARELADQRLDCMWDDAPGRALVEREAATLRTRAEAAEAKVAKLEEALRPFAGDKMPGLRRSLIDYDRYGLRRLISPMEIAMNRARNALHPEPSP